MSAFWKKALRRALWAGRANATQSAGLSTSYALGEHWEEFIRAQVHGGRYANESEVIRDALRLFEEEQRPGAALAALVGDAIGRITRGTGSVPKEVLEHSGANGAASSPTPRVTGAMPLPALPHRKGRQSLQGYVRENLEQLEHEIFAGVRYEALVRAIRASGFVKVALGSLHSAVFRARKMRAERAGVPPLQLAGKTRRVPTPEVVSAPSPARLETVSMSECAWDPPWSPSPRKDAPGPLM
jgi:antitoxin ParD1/3/4